MSIYIPVTDGYIKFNRITEVYTFDFACPTGLEECFFERSSLQYIMVITHCHRKRAINKGMPYRQETNIHQNFVAISLEILVLELVIDKEDLIIPVGFTCQRIVAGADCVQHECCRNLGEIIIGVACRFGIRSTRTEPYF